MAILRTSCFVLKVDPQSLSEVRGHRYVIYVKQPQVAACEPLYVWRSEFEA